MAGTTRCARPLLEYPLTHTKSSCLLQTGKSYTVEHLVPAVVADAVRKRGEEEPFRDTVVLRLSGEMLYRSVSGWP